MQSSSGIKSSQVPSLQPQANNQIDLNLKNNLLPVNDLLIREILKCFPFLDAFSSEYPAKNTSATNASVSGVSCLSIDKRGMPCHGNNADAKSVFSLMIAASMETVLPLSLPRELWLKEQLSNWVQLSGHKDSVVPATDHTVWKKSVGIKGEDNEAEVYKLLMTDACRPFVPKFYRQVEHNGDVFIEIEDLTRQFNQPAIMDVKMGTRTFLEHEVANSKKRQDLYMKMVQIDPTEPTLEENDEKAITKLRYMQFRENESSTATLGFRIDGLKERSRFQLHKDFKKVKRREEIMSIFRDFFRYSTDRYMTTQALTTLKNIRLTIEQSVFFKTHEVIGSSLLFLYDDQKIGIWLIDFAKVIPVHNLISGQIINHRTPWCVGNHEDGYLLGLDNLIDIFEEILL